MSKSKDLQKATAASSAPANIITILNELKNGVKADEALLRSTKIGVIVNRSKQHKDPAVASLAGEIVTKWRVDIQKQKGTASPINGKKTSSPSGTSSPVPTNGASKPKHNVPLDQRDYKKDKVNIERTQQSTRDNCIGLLYNGLCYNSPDSSAGILDKAVAVEAAGFSILGPETNEGYKSKMRSLFQNLKNKSNPLLRKQVLSGTITPDAFVKMRPEDLRSEERRKEDERYEKENLKDAQVILIGCQVNFVRLTLYLRCHRLNVQYRVRFSAAIQRWASPSELLPTL